MKYGVCLGLIVKKIKALERFTVEQSINDVINQLKNLLDDVLFLKGRTKFWSNQTKLFGNIPELDAITAMNVIVAMENKFGVFIEYYEFNANNFATIESLANFIYQKIFELNYLVSGFEINRKLLEKQN
jgi:acyl carrier protein